MLFSGKKIKNQKLLRDISETIRDEIVSTEAYSALDRLRGARLQARSSLWGTIRERHLVTHGVCEACGQLDNLSVHHKKPYHLFPQLELEPSNLITLCEDGPAGMNCHLLLGHGGNWICWIEAVEQYAAQMRQMIDQRRRP